MGASLLNDLAPGAGRQAESGLKRPGEMALVGKPATGRDVGQPRLAGKLVAGGPAAKFQQMAVGRQACMAGHGPGQMPGGQPGDSGQIVQADILGKLRGQHFQGQTHGPGFLAAGLSRRMVVAVADDPGGQQGEQEGLLGQGGDFGSQEQPVRARKTGGQDRVLNDARTKMGRRRARGGR